MKETTRGWKLGLYRGPRDRGGEGTLQEKFIKNSRLAKKLWLELFNLLAGVC